ncbi:hypothetical protein EST38_g13182 [Candolleomyces aberdarensis]|uniref:Six-hairpin glycosidase-like protein n=1 Tax=Candolleomyces aberdarensis TaxID=2316362 RepID=A0A4Q2D2W0_9AGAR|nr:hypothetical protein EST38_g13182 [Candolleomyces aberdarensis]
MSPTSKGRGSSHLCNSLFFFLAAALSFLTLTVHAQSSSTIDTSSPTHGPSAPINRRSLVTRFNPTRHSTLASTTPIQVGNGNFAFGTDITSLQTFLPFSTMSSWGWKTDALPPNRTQSDIDGYKGVSWLNHGRPVQYDFGGPPDIEAWLRGSPNRVNLGRVGLRFWPDSLGDSQAVNVSETDLQGTKQLLDLWTGILTSEFTFQGTPVKVSVASDLKTDTIAITLDSVLVRDGRIGLFLDFPWNEGKEKFSAPFVGYWDVPEKHMTNLTLTQTPSNVVRSARTRHHMESDAFDTYIGGAGSDAFSIHRVSPTSHLYEIRPQPRLVRSREFAVSIQFSPAKESVNDPSNSGQSVPSVSSPIQVFDSSKKGWEEYWTQSGFVDVLTGSTDPRAEELQRRIILSRYLMRVNEAGDSPPQESGLVNNGWFGKFHMEMYFWHSAHWALWNNWSILNLSSSIYARFLSASKTLSQVQQGWSSGARWPKMTDPSTGRSSPGELNNLLIWQQPHPLVFALYEYRSYPTKETLRKWKEVVKGTADWMSAFAWFNETTGRYDLGPPLHVVSEDTSPNVTLNPAFELAYWKFGLGVAEEWIHQLNEEPVPTEWTAVRQGLAPLPMDVDDGTYSVYEGIDRNFWTDSKYTSDHPALVGLHGWLPPTEGLDLGVARRTAEKVWTHWNTTNCWGWDFPMLAMSAARNGAQEKAIDWLLHPEFQFDDVGMPIGGTRVPTPYFPGAGSLLYAIAMMAAGWDGARQGNAPGFPADGWRVRAEGLNKAL